MHKRYIPADFSPINIVKQGIFWLIHLGCLAAFYTGVTWTAFGICMALYFIRMFGICGGYHRYFSHRTYKTGRLFQFLLAFLGATSAQKGPLWWAGHHRHHHRFSDTEEDIHSTFVHGLWWAHVGWVLSTHYIETRYDLVKDLYQFPELRWLDRNHIVAPLSLIALLFALGYSLQAYAPGLHTTPMQIFVWGFCVSTTLLYHGTFMINSFAHLIGTKRFETGDHSKNSLILSLITLGEGWHNNHHRYPGSERQGFYWWELDVSHYILKGFEKLGLVWDLRAPPSRVYEEAKLRKAV
jgi:stearoyl-CoA desaturase (delta-9 desaturase)